MELKLVGLGILNLSTEYPSVIPRLKSYDIHSPLRIHIHIHSSPTLINLDSISRSSSMPVTTPPNIQLNRINILHHRSTRSII